MKKKSILLLLPFAAMAMAGCGPTPTPPPSDPCESAVVQLNKTTLSLEVGASETLVASMSVEGCDLGEVTWLSDHPDIAKVENGEVTALAVGTAKITANGAECVVTVTAQPGPVVKHVEDIRIEPNLYPKMKVGDPDYQINFTVLPEDAENKAVTFSCDTPAVATVSDAGVIHAVAPGKANITVTSVDVATVTKKLEVTVTAADIVVPSVTSDEYTKVVSGELTNGSQVEFIAQTNGKVYGMKKYDSGNNIKGAECAIGEESIIIDEAVEHYFVEKNDDNTYSFKDSAGNYIYAAGGTSSNHLKAKAEKGETSKFNVTIADGVASIICAAKTTTHNVLALNYNGGTPLFSCYTALGSYSPITLYEKVPVAPATIELDQSSLTMEAGSVPQMLHATVGPEGAPQDVEWESNDPTVATVIGGVVTPVAEGEATITVKVASNEEIATTCAVTVTPATRTLTGITATGLQKTEYTEGDKLDLTGLVVTATYDKGDPETITAGYETNIALDKELEMTDTSLVISYGGFYADAITLTINEKVYHAEKVYIDNGLYPNVEVGDVYQIQAHVEPEEVKEQGLTYEVKSGSEELLSVSDTGEVTILAKGTGYVVVKSVDDPTVTAEVKFTITNKKIALPDATSAGFAKIASSDKLVEGQLIQFYSSTDEKVYGMGQGTGNNQPPVESVIESSAIVAGSGVASYKLVKNADNTYSFLTSEGKYLAATGTASGNYLKVVDELTENAKFNVSIADGFASIVCPKEGVAGNTMALNPNNGSPIFSCYKPATAAGYSKISMFAKDVEVETINLSAASSAFVVGNSLTVEAEVLPTDAKDKTLVWTVENDNPAGCISVNDAGVVTASEAGTATIKATAANGVYGEYSVTATAGTISVTGVTLSSDNMVSGEPKTLALVAEDTEQLIATVAPADATDNSVAWSIESETVTGCVEVSDAGLVTAVKPGSATVKVTTTDGSFADQVVVTVSEKKINVDSVDKFDVNPTTIELQSGYGTGSSEYFAWTDLSKNGDGQIQGNNSSSYKSELHNTYAFSKEIKYVKYTVGKASGNDAQIEFRFGDSVSPEGNAVIVGKNNAKCLLNAVGTYIFVPTAGCTYFSMKNLAYATYLSNIEIGFVEYVAPAVESVTLDQTELAMNVGDGDVTLVPTILPADAEPKSAVWSSDKETVATVTNGVVHAVGEGTASITYTVDGKVGSCVVTVSAAKTFTELTTTGGFRTSYTTSDSAFAIKDLKVYANYNDSSKEEVTDYTVTWSNTFDNTLGGHVSTPTIHWNGHDLALSEVSYSVTTPVQSSVTMAMSCANGDGQPSGSDGSTAFTAATLLSTTQTISKVSYAWSITNAGDLVTAGATENCYIGKGSTMKVGKGGGDGYFNLIFAEGVKIKSVKITAYGAADTVKLTVDNAGDAQTIGTTSADYTFTFTANTNILKITGGAGKTSSNKVAYISSIVVTYEA